MKQPRVKPRVSRAPPPGLREGGIRLVARQAAHRSAMFRCHIGERGNSFGRITAIPACFEEPLR